MKSLFRVLILVFSFVFIVGCSTNDLTVSSMSFEKRDLEFTANAPKRLIYPVTNESELISEWGSEYQIVAHALGGLQDQYDYTNSLEAFYVNYELGTRLYEVDLDLSSEGEIVLAHGWEMFRNEFSQIGGIDPLSLEDFNHTKIHGEYTSLTFDDLLQLMVEFEDFYIIIDSKTFDMITTQVMYEKLVDKVNSISPDLMDRIIPQAYDQDMYVYLDYNYDFNSVIFTLYSIYHESDPKALYDFIIANEIPTVVMHMDNEWAIKVISDISAYAKMQGNSDKFNVYIHTVNEIETAKKIVEEYGFNGIYTDYIGEDEFDDLIK